MKKLILPALTFIMVISLAACSGSAEQAAKNEENSTLEQTEAAKRTAESDGQNTKGSAFAEEEVVDENLPKLKFAMCYTTFTDKLGAQFKSSTEYLAKAFNVDMQYVEISTNSDEKIAMLESLAQSDVDGILYVGVNPANLEALSGIPYVSFCAEPTTDEVAKECAAYENYLGAICESDYDLGYSAAEALYEEGCRNFCLAGYTKGVSKTHDQRALGFRTFLEEHPDTKLLAEGYSAALYADAVSSFAASYPEMDGLFVTGGNEAVYQAMATEGLSGYVKLACVNISESTGDYLQKQDLSWIAGGQYGTAMVAFGVLYNYLIDGTRMISDTSVTQYRPFLEVASYENYELYLKYVDSGIPVYTVDEIKNMIHYFNPDADQADLEEINKSYSLNNISERHKDLLK